MAKKFFDSMPEVDRNALSLQLFRSASEEENFFSYGILFDTQVSSPNVSRIGNASLHRELPIQSAIKACLLLDNGNVNYYLNPTDWT